MGFGFSLIDKMFISCYIIVPMQTVEEVQPFIDDEIGKIGIAYGSLSLFEKYKDIKAIKRNILLPSSLTEED